MAEGTIKRLTDRGFGFIETSPGNDIFFHMSNVEGVRFEDLREGQKVSFDEAKGPRGHARRTSALFERTTSGGSAYCAA